MIILIGLGLFLLVGLVIGLITGLQRQKRLSFVSRQLSDSDRLVQFLSYAAYNKNLGRKRFVQIPLHNSFGNTIVSKLPIIINLDSVKTSTEAIELEADKALLQPGKHQWREVREFAQKTLSALLIGSPTPDKNTVIALETSGDLPNFEFFKTALNRFKVTEVLILLYGGRQDVTQLLGEELVKYLSGQYLCTVQTGDLGVEDFNLLRNAKNLIVLHRDSFALMSAVAGYNESVVKLSLNRAGEISAWPEHFVLLQETELFPTSALSTLIQKPVSPLLDKPLSVLAKLTLQISEEVKTARVKRCSEGIF
jgi:hypothetical protein